MGETNGPGLVATFANERHTRPRFAASFNGLRLPPGTVTQWRLGNAWDLAMNRNSVAEEALRLGLAWVLFLDDDLVFPPDLALRLLQHGADVVGPLVTFRRPPFDPIGMAPYPVTADLSDEELVVAHVACSQPPLDTPGLVEAGAIGTAGMLVSAEVLAAMPSPWFEFGRLPGEPALEDFWFCAKARRLGFKVWRDNSTAAGHLSEVAVWPGPGGRAYIDFNAGPTPR